MSAIERAADGVVGRNFLALGSGEVAARLIAFAATVYIARVLGSEYYGVIGFATAITLYLNRITDAGVELGLGVREIAIAPTRISELAPAILTARLLVASVLVVIVSIVGVFWLPQPDGVMLALYSLTLFAAGVSSRWLYLGRERGRLVAFARALGEAVMVVLVLALVRGPADVTRVPLAQFAGDSIAALLLLIVLRSTGLGLRPRLNWAVVRPLVPRASLLVASAFFGLAIYNADLIVLRIFRDTATVGLYTAAYTLISFLVNLGTAYSMSLLPTLTRLQAEPSEQLKLYRTATAQVFAISLPIAVGGMMIAPAIVDFFFGAEYAASALPLQILAWAVPMAVMRDVPIMALMSRGGERRIFRLTGYAAGFNLLLNFALIPRWGMIGAAAATVATEILRMFMAFGLARHDGFTVGHFGRLWRPVLATAAMAVVLLLSGPTTVWVAIPAGVVGYGLALVLVGGLRLRRDGLPALTV